MPLASTDTQSANPVSQRIDPALTAERTALIAVIPNLSADEQSQILARGFRSFRDGELPVLTAIARPDDYDNDLARGTVNYDPRFNNYSYYSVIIADQSIIDSTNFAQAVLNTDAITGEGLVFTNCNLTNINIHKSWTLTNCLTAQSWIVQDPSLDAQGNPILDANGDPVMVESRLFVCSDPSQLKGNEVQPDNAITSRDY